MEQASGVNSEKSSHTEKLEKFKEGAYKRWQHKMLFYLTTLNLEHTVTGDAPKAEGDDILVEKLSAIDAWKHSEYLCKNYILNALDDTLYDVYAVCKTAKELWESLERKYKTEGLGSKKFVVAKFLDSKMVDSKVVVTQVEDLHKIIHDIIAKGMKINDNFKLQQSLKNCHLVGKISNAISNIRESVSEILA
ncbi:hypothetical protein L3X38_043217 [Prunus dulcis]|uniref:DUF4219 domain-containing protein n=1 Tax=Prunus dulcis TaxID=3755 RepID=A0AAD4UY58_PRUDU|nr:hypothetical protein L3X38_043217 [Prunus dulcis]